MAEALDEVFLQPKLKPFLREVLPLDDVELGHLLLHFQLTLLAACFFVV